MFWCSMNELLPGTALGRPVLTRLRPLRVITKPRTEWYLYQTARWVRRGGQIHPPRAPLCGTPAWLHLRPPGHTPPFGLPGSPGQEGPGPVPGDTSAR